MNLFIEYLRRNLHHGSIALVTPDGSHYVLGHGQPEAHWIFTDPQAMNRILRCVSVLGPGCVSCAAREASWSRTDSSSLPSS